MDPIDHSSPEKISPERLPKAESPPEISMVEASDATGVSFTPELWMQRRHWALEVLRSENVRSVLDLGCGPGALLETLVIPPSTIYEPPIRAQQDTDGQLPSPVDSDEEESEGRELFITRLGALDPTPSVLPSANEILVVPSSSALPRWEPLVTELWLGGIERYNSRLEGYDAIVALEVVEHLDPKVLSRFGVVTMGTYKPRLLLVTTPNFDFNAKFPRREEESSKRGFRDPTGRTERVFRHSDHKVEMTSEEFRDWAEGAASDWGYVLLRRSLVARLADWPRYTVEISGVGISSVPSYYPETSSGRRKPIYASQTAIFRIASGLPTRSPRSVRTVELPFMPGSKESSHPHKLVSKNVHPATSPTADKKAPGEIRRTVQDLMRYWDRGTISLGELWAVENVAQRCGGSKRYLVACLGGYGDVDALDGQNDFKVERDRGRGLKVVWKEFVEKPKVKEQTWGPERKDDGPKEAADGW
ncbi:small RNA 2'-O-methyltransferase, partial [Tremellales sp. Uapishka_1]